MQQSIRRGYIDASTEVGCYITELMQCAGEVYNNSIQTLLETKNQKGVWLREQQLLKLVKSDKLHSSTNQAIVHDFFNDWWRFIEAKKNYGNARGAFKKTLYKLTWYRNAIITRKDLLILSNGSGNAPIIIDGWDKTQPDRVEINPGRQYHTFVAVYIEDIDDHDDLPRVRLIDKPWSNSKRNGLTRIGGR